MIRLLIYFAIGYLIYRWWKAKGRKKEEIRDAESGRKSLESAELVQDPQCGVYFVKEHGVKTDIDGETIYFCSEECRQAFLARRSEKS